MEISPNKRIFIKGHFEGELWGLTTHPKENKFYTIGDENLLACWDMKKKTC